jgi:hypothetical protein
MSDDLPEPEYDADRGGNNSQSNDEKDGNSQKRIDWAGLLEVAGGIVFWVVGGGLADAGFHTPAYFFYFLAVACGIGIAYQQLKRSRLKPFSFAIFCVILILDAGLFTFLSLYHSPEPRLHFAFDLVTDGAPTVTIRLTNDFLEKIPSTNMTPADGMIVLPLPQGKTNAILVFSVVNDSPKTAEDLQCLLTFPKRLNGELDPQWTPAALRSPGRNIIIGPGMVTNATQSWSFACGTALLAGNSYALPQIRLLQLPLEQPQIFELLARAKDFPPQVLKFELYPIVLTNGSFKAFAFKPKRIDDFIVQFSRQQLEEEAQK